MENPRLFVSLPVEYGLAKDIHRAFSKLNLDWSKIKKVEAENIHITLKFLGETPIEKIPLIIEALEKVKISTSDIHLDIIGPSIFGTHQPKVLALATDFNPQLQELYDQIEDLFFQSGIAHKEVRKFSPHITLARIKKQTSFEEINEFKNWNIKKSFYINSFDLQESQLAKTGPQYNVMQSFDL